MIVALKIKGGRLKDPRKYLTGAANFHFVIPIFVNAAFANRTIDKPAKVSTLKFPGRTLFFLFGSTVFYSPAWFAAFAAVIDAGYQKIHLALDRRWYGAPALLIAVDCFQGGSQKLCHLFLGFFQV